ncbi:MAG: mobile mystery protein B [bacterium]|nr:mobile mystery protein B [bacterium]
MMNLNKGLKGETPLKDSSGLRLSWVKTVSDLDKAEYKNIALATMKYLSATPSRKLASFTAKWMLKLHNEMLSDVWKWAGKIRNAELTIGIDWCRIEIEMETLAQDAAFWREQETAERDLIEEATRLHHRAVKIHPFHNGNGRWARLMADIWLRQHSHTGIAWPENAMSAQSPIRQEYIAALKTADTGNIDPLTELHRRLARR